MEKNNKGTRQGQLHARIFLFVILTKKTFIWITKLKHFYEQSLYHDYFNHWQWKLTHYFVPLQNSPQWHLIALKRTSLYSQATLFTTLWSLFFWISNLVSWVEKYWLSFSSQTENIPHIFLIPFPKSFTNPQSLSLTLVFLPEKITLQLNKTLQSLLGGSCPFFAFSETY